MIDLRLLPIVAGVWLGVLDRWVFVLALTASTIFALSLKGERRRWILVGTLGLVVSFLGVWLRSTAVEALPHSGSHSFIATVTGDLQIRHSRVVGQNFHEKSGSLAIRIEQFSQGDLVQHVRAPARLLVDAGFPELTPGSQFTIDARVIPKLGDVALLRANGPPRLLASASMLQTSAQKVRMGLREAASHLPRRIGGLLPGLVDGDTLNLDARLNQEMRDTNLTHLTAVSGANLALVAAFVLYLSRLVGVRRRFLPIVSAVSIASFVVIARPDPSVMRAAAMAGVLILATALELPALGITSLMVAVLILVLIDPSQGRKPGFVLSVLATAGILLFASGWAKKLQRWLPRWLAIALAVPLAAQALCTPYLVVVSQQLSLVGVWTNVLAGPAVAPATIFGFVAGLISTISPTLAALCAWLSAPALWWISTIAGLGANLPFANIPWFSGWRGVLTASIVVVAIVFGFQHRPRLMFAGYCAFIILLAYVRVASPMWPMPNWSLVMCDVGQGDGFVLRASNSQAVVVDAGPDPILIDQCLRDLGITKVPLVVLTHNHADHVEGLPGVLRNRSVAQIWVTPELEPAFETRRIRHWIGTRPVMTVQLNQRHQVGALSLTAVWPSERLSVGSIPNNSSVVLIAEWAGHRALLLGDVEAQAQGILARSIHGPFDIVKVAHHGSANQDPSWFADLHARAALVSVGAVNPYGHPSTRTLREWARTGARILRSDRDGAVAIAFDTRRISVAARGHPWWRWTGRMGS